MSQKYAHVDAEGLVLGFYADDLHAEWPDGAIPITDEDWQTLLQGQGAGKRMKVHPDGSPELVDPPPPTQEALAGAARARRDRALLMTDGPVMRERDASFQHPERIHAAPFVALLDYRQALRDVPQQKGFPETIAWPDVPPGFNLAAP